MALIVCAEGAAALVDVELPAARAVFCPSSWLVDAAALGKTGVTFPPALLVCPAAAACVAALGSDDDGEAAAGRDIGIP